MRYRNVRNLIIEGPDGVGKSTLIEGLFNYYNYKYMCYHRGELSNRIFAEKFKRPFYETQRGLPFLYIVLVADSEDLKTRIINRANKENWTTEDLQKELETVKYSHKYFLCANDMEDNYDIHIINTSGKTEEQVLKSVISILNAREEWDKQEVSCDFT